MLSRPADLGGLPHVAGPGHHGLNGLAQQQPELPVLAEVGAGRALAGARGVGSRCGEALRGWEHELGPRAARRLAAAPWWLHASRWVGTLGGYHAGSSEQVLVCALGRGELARRPRAGGERGLCPRGPPLRELQRPLGPLGAGEAHGCSWWPQEHLDAGVLDQAQLLLDPVQLLLLPPDVGLQHPRPLLQLVPEGLEHAGRRRQLCQGDR